MTGEGYLGWQPPIFLEAGDQDAGSRLVLGVVLEARLQLAGEEGICLHRLGVTRGCADQLVGVVVGSLCLTLHPVGQLVNDDANDQYCMQNVTKICQ